MTIAAAADRYVTTRGFVGAVVAWAVVAYRGRLIAALTILAGTSTLYVWALREYADFSDWL